MLKVVNKETHPLNQQVVRDLRTHLEENPDYIKSFRKGERICVLLDPFLTEWVDKLSEKDKGDFWEMYNLRGFDWEGIAEVLKSFKTE
jgi:hypothetical protein